MKKIGILCASDTELAPFLPCIANRQTTGKAMLQFHTGQIRQTEVVAVYSGVCRVNAAVAAQLLIDLFQVHSIVNAGTAGGMQEEVQLFDTVVARQSAYHDMDADILTEFHPWMPSVYFPADEQMLAAARAYSRTSQHRLLFGRIVTGERFVGESGRAEICARFAPLAVDMETAGVAHVCYVNRVPFLSIRTITDTAAHSGMENFERNCQRASEISAEIVMDLLGAFA